MVASTLVGMHTEAEVHDNARALDGEPDPALLAGVHDLLSEMQDVEWPSELPENNPPSALHL